MQQKNFRKYAFIILSILKSGKSAAYYALMIKCLGLLMWPVDFTLSVLERLFFPKNKVVDRPIIFVVGIHRTGSTYVSQVLSEVLDVVPIGNFFSIFPRSKYLIHFLGKAFFPLRRLQASKKNFYGISKGIYAIGDVYELWDKWFGSDHYNTPTKLAIQKKKHLLDYFYWINKAWGKTLLSKNNRNSLVIQELALLFPQAYFVVIERNPSDVILSTIKASKDFFGSEDYMWGLIPNREFKKEKFENKILAYCNQYLGLEETINSQLSQLPQGSYSRVSYEEFCSTPEKYIKQILESIKKIQGVEIGCDLDKMSTSKIASSVPDSEIKKEIEEALDTLKRE